MERLPEALAPLGQWRQFVGYRLTPDPQHAGKMKKLPVSADAGHACSVTSPANWRSFDEVSAAVAGGRADGVGFVFTESDPFWFLDIDNCRTPDGQWSDLALSLIRALPGAAVEVSQSGNGLHVIGTGTPPPHSCKNTALGLEFYHAGRFVALTGNCGPNGRADADLTAALPSLIGQYFPPAQSDGVAGDGPADDWDGYADDSELLAHACNVVSAAARFGQRATFRQLFEGDEAALGQSYPDDSGARPYDESSADIALAQHLAFWTGKDGPRIERLMRASALVRDKWDRPDYLPRTIDLACGRTAEVHKRKRAELPESAVQDAAPPAPSVSAELVSGYQLLTLADQLDYFAGCVYIQNRHAVLTPAGAVLKPDQFRVAYGGYDFMMDDQGRRVVRNAWEAFTESQGVRHPKVERTMFRPDLPPGELLTYGGKPCVNSYRPVPVKRVAGDPAPFLDHVKKLLPNDQDRAIALAYLAACVQHVGVKFQWCPLFQGVEGNGKTLLSRCVAEAVGMDLTSIPKATEISAKFNSWIRDKVLVYVEDIYIAEGRRDVFEALKPIITNDWQPVELKGVDQATEYVVANLILNSNHKDGIRKTGNDRRVAPFYTAQQHATDLARDGMTGDYFPRLYAWLREQDGYAIVAEYLHTYAIPDELNPAKLCHRAPETSATREAIEVGMGSVEQEIREACDEGRPGFAGGWISSMALDKLLSDMRANRMIPHNKRRQILVELGYDWHPGLNSGRVNNPVMPDNGKPRLFIRAGHIHANLQTATEIAAAYTAAQSTQPGKAAQVFVDSGENKA